MVKHSKTPICEINRQQTNREPAESSQYNLKTSKCNSGIKIKAALKVISSEIYLEKKKLEKSIFVEK